MRRNVSAISLQEQIASAMKSLSTNDDDIKEDLHSVAAAETKKEATQRPLPSNLVKHTCVGHGGYGTVWVVEDAATQRHYALKQLRKGHVVALKMVNDAGRPARVRWLMACTTSAKPTGYQRWTL